MEKLKPEQTKRSLGIETTYLNVESVIMVT